MTMQTTTQNRAKNQQVSKPVAKAFRALHKAEAAMLALSGGEQDFTPAEHQAFESIIGARNSLWSGPTWTPFTINYK